MQIQDRNPERNISWDIHHLFELVKTTLDNSTDLFKFTLIPLSRGILYQQKPLSL